MLVCWIENSSLKIIFTENFEDITPLPSKSIAANEKSDINLIPIPL